MNTYQVPAPFAVPEVRTGAWNTESHEPELTSVGPPNGNETESVPFCAVMVRVPEFAKVAPVEVELPKYAAPATDTAPEALFTSIGDAVRNAETDDVEPEFPIAVPNVL